MSAVLNLRIVKLRMMAKERSRTVRIPLRTAQALDLADLFKQAEQDFFAHSENHGRKSLYSFSVDA